MTVLGKRKASKPSISEEEANEIFRRHFEAQFLPLEESATKPPAAPASRSEDEEGSADEDEDESEESEWGGLSDDDVSDDEQGMVFRHIRVDSR